MCFLSRISVHRPGTTTWMELSHDYLRPYVAKGPRSSLDTTKQVEHFLRNVLEMRQAMHNGCT